MYIFIRFSDTFFGIYKKKNFNNIQIQDEFCVVKHNGFKYETIIIMWDSKKQIILLVLIYGLYIFRGIFLNVNKIFRSTEYQR